MIADLIADDFPTTTHGLLAACGASSAAFAGISDRPLAGPDDADAVASAGAEASHDPGFVVGHYRRLLELRGRLDGYDAGARRAGLSDELAKVCRRKRIAIETGMNVAGHAALARNSGRLDPSGTLGIRWECLDSGGRRIWDSLVEAVSALRDARGRNQWYGEPNFILRVVS